MKPVTVSRPIEAPIEKVFEIVSDIRNFSRVIPSIVMVEFLGEQRSGPGTRFRETRMMGSREAATELELTEYEPPTKVRMIADTHGCVWDSVFALRPEGTGCVLTLVMEARPHKLMARMINPLIRGKIVAEVAKDLEAVKQHCEAGTEA